MLTVLAACFVAAAPRFSFDHGVASGDATDSSFVLWTRITRGQDIPSRRYRVWYSVCEAEENGKPPADLWAVPNPRCRKGRVATGPWRDFTVKTEPKGLKENTIYFYQFSTRPPRITREGEGVRSEVGRTRTLPSLHTDVKELNYGVVSCANYPHGYFHSYELLANAEKLDFVLHLGDYVYEYGSYAYPATSEQVRPFLHQREATTLEEYRTRYATYRTDKGLQRLHRRAPMYAIWDDHEVADNSRSDGARNHQEVCPTPSEPDFEELSSVGEEFCDKDEGPYTDRVNAATKAYYEWMPIREPRGIYLDPELRKKHSFEFHFGNLASFAGYDTRLSKRTISDPTPLFFGINALTIFAATNTDVSKWDEEPLRSELEGLVRSVKNDLDDTAEILGKESRGRMECFFKESKDAKVPWQVYASPTIMEQVVTPDFQDTAAKLVTALQEFGADAATAAQVAGGFNAITQGGTSSDAAARLLYLAGKHKVPFNSDSWDGFVAEREKVLDILLKNTNNAVVVSGDSHNAYAAELRLGDKDANDGPSVAVSFDTASAASRGMEEIFQPFNTFLKAVGSDAIEFGFRQNNPATKYANVKDRGFVMFKVTPEKHTGEFVMINTDRGADADSHATVLRNEVFNFNHHYCDARLTVEAGNRGRFSSIEEAQFFIPQACVSKFSPTALSDIFNP